MNDYDDDDERLELLPPWREALRRFAESGFRAGDTITHAWFFEAFGLPLRTAETTAMEWEKVALQFMRHFCSLREALLTERQMDLASTRGVGYRIVPPSEQTSLAYGDCVAELRRAFRRGLDRIINVDQSKLTAEQRRENADALAKMSQLRAMTKAAREFPRIEYEE